MNYANAVNEERVNADVQERAEELAREWATLNDQAEQIKAAMDDVKAAMRELATLDDEHPQAVIPAGGLTITLTANRRLDAVKVVERFPVAAYPGLWDIKPNTTAIRKVVSPDEYATLMSVVGEPKVVVK